MTIVLSRDGIRHRVEPDWRDVRTGVTACGIRVAFTGPCDPRSSYQRAVRRDCRASVPCEACG